MVNDILSKREVGFDVIPRITVERAKAYRARHAFAWYP